MKVSMAIMAHPARQDFVDELTAGQLHDVPVVWDQQNDRWDTGRRSMLAYDPTADWHLVVQDDAILCSDFVATVHRALACVPADRPVAFYTGRTRPNAELVRRMVEAAERLDRRWLEFPGPWWGPAVAVPVHMIDRMVAWGDENPKIANYDKRMAAHFDSLGVRCWYSYPSLVDHRTEGNPSLVPGRGNAPIRTAWCFANGTAEAVAWATEPVTLTDQVFRYGGQRTWRHRTDGRLRTTVVGGAADCRYAAATDLWEVVG